MKMATRIAGRTLLRCLWHIWEGGARFQEAERFRVLDVELGIYAEVKSRICGWLCALIGFLSEEVAALVVERQGWLACLQRMAPR